MRDLLDTATPEIPRYEYCVTSFSYIHIIRKQKWKIPKRENFIFRGNSYLCLKYSKTRKLECFFTSWGGSPLCLEILQYFTVALPVLWIFQNWDLCLSSLVHKPLSHHIPHNWATTCPKLSISWAKNTYPPIEPPQIHLFSHDIIEIHQLNHNLSTEPPHISKCRLYSIHIHQMSHHIVF